MVSISVLLPARNAADTLPAALECVLGQEDFGLDMEVVVADDGSDDATLEIAQLAGYRDPRVRILALPPSGLVNALNSALTKAEGRYIARMDADDLCMPDRLRRQLHHMERHPRLDVVGTGVRMIPETEVSENMHDYVRWQNRLLTHRALVRNLLVESPLTHGTALFRREALERIGGWREVDGPEDLDLWLRGAAAGWRFGKVNRELYLWRDGPDRTSRRDPRLSREGFRRVAMNACAETIPRDRQMLIWGWGRSLEDWDEGMRSRGFRVRSVEVNPRGLRGGGGLPHLPASEKVGCPHITPAARARNGAADLYWILAYGTVKSRLTLQGVLQERGYRAGKHYRFVS
jgi:glycosyltransferase involved in cell wall biosynthesis